MSQKLRQLEHRNLKHPKSDKTWTKWFLQKALWRVKWPCLEGFPKCSTKELILFLQASSKKFDKLIWYKSCHFSTRIFFQNLQGVTLWLLNHCCCGQNSRGNICFEFIESFNTRFLSSRSDHEKRYFQKLGFASSPWLFPRFHFTRESNLPDEHFKKHSSCWKVLWMSIFNLRLFEIFIVIHMFDWSRTQKYGLLWEK